MKTRGFTLIELMIVIAVIAILAAISIPGLMKSQMSANERNASASLKTISTSQYDFRSNDRDGNALMDFWTGDVSGLFRLQQGGISNRLIEVSLARADGAPMPAGSGNGLMGPLVVPAAPKASYWFFHLITDEDADPDMPYQVDLGDAMGAVHNFNRYGVMAYPDSYSRSGKMIFVTNETAAVYKQDPQGEVASQVAGPRAPIAFMNYPDDPLSNGWGPMD